MKKKNLIIIGLLLVASLVLAACNTAVPETIVETVVVEVETAGETIVETVVVTEVEEVVVTATAEPEAAVEETAEEPAEEEMAEEDMAESVLIGAFSVGPGGGEPESGKPWTGAAGHTQFVKLYITPTIFNEDITEIVPFAAESWESSDDFTVWTYTLRDDLLWSDGEVLDANDWKFTADFVTDPGFVVLDPLNQAFAFSNVVGYEEHASGEADELAGVQVIDDRTIEYTLKTPDPRHFTTQFRTYFLPEHAIDFAPSEYLETDWWLNPDKQVGSGPFTVSEFERDAFLAMDKNPNYFLGEPHVDRLIDRFFGGDITAAVLALSADEIDFTYLEPTDIPTLDDSYDIFSNNSNVVVYTDIHYRNDEVPDYWDDIRVRQAILHAIDRNAITEQILDGTHYPIPCPVPFPELWPDDVDWYEYDPALAQSLLAEAGVDPADITMEWVGHSGYDNIHHNSALQAVQAFLSDIGVTMTYRFVDVPTFRDRYTPDGEWTFHYRGAGIPIFGADYGRAWINAGSQGGDFKGYDMVGSGLEAAVEAINAAPSNEEYFAAIGDFCKLHNELLPDLQLWIGNRYGAADNTLENFWWQPAGGGGPYIDNAHLWEVGS